MEFHQTFDESTPAPIRTGQLAPPPTEEMADLMPPIVAPALQSHSVQYQHDAGPGRGDIQFNGGSSPRMEADADQYDTQIPPGFNQRRARRDGRSFQRPVEHTRSHGHRDHDAGLCSALAVGTHHLFLTAISRRGLSGHAKRDRGVAMNQPMANQRDFLGVGWKFPLQVTPGGQIAQARYEQRIEESIYLILSTSKGERVMLPDFGCGIHDLVFAPNNSTTIAVVVQTVREALVAFEPRIDVLDISAESAPEEPNLLLIRINYRIRANNARGNLVYPFYIKESA